MKTKKILINSILFIGLFLAFYILFKTVKIQKWNTVASSLAVITAIIGSWSAQRIIWKEEEELQPNLNLQLNLKSRKGFIQFQIENTGKSSAYDVQIKWKKPLIGINNKEIHFKSGTEGVDFKQIGKNQKFSCIVGVTAEILKKNEGKKEPLDFLGEIQYKKSPKGLFKIKKDFFISLEPYSSSISLDYEDDIQNFYSEASKIHKDLIEIIKTLKR